MLEKGFGIAKVEVNASTGVHDHAKWKPKWKIEKYNSKGELYAVEEFDGNLLLFDGISEFMKAACSVGGTAFSEANARIGVGDGTTEAKANQKGLQGTNKAYATMDAGYPKVQGNTMTFRATFGSGQAAFAWQEFVIDNGTIALNRKVEYHGVKVSQDTWAISCSITIS